MPGYVLVATPAAVLMAVAVITPAPATATPQCRYGDHVTADCPSGACPDGIDAQNAPCTGPELDPLFPPPPPFQVELGFGGAAV